MADHTKVNLKHDVDERRLPAHRAELIAVGAPHTGPGDAELENDWWSD